LALFKESDQKVFKSSYTFVNIGFNKGYNFATWLNVFAPSWNVDASHWYEALKTMPTLKVDHLCGSCSDCKVKPYQLPLVGKDPSIHIVGVDLNKHNIDVVNATLAVIRKSKQITEDMLSVTLIHAAGGNDNAGAPATLKIPRCESGDELCKIPTDGTVLDTSIQYDDVPILGIDKLVRGLHLTRHKHLRSDRSAQKQATAGDHHGASSSSSSSGGGRGGGRNMEGGASGEGGVIDLLHIDTEGNDAEVLKSARSVLRHRRVRVLIFEYHGYTPWDKSQLADVQQEITKNDMECFFMGQNRLWPISGTCWHRDYEFHHWSNVMCVLRSDSWYEAIQPIVVTPNSILTRFREGELIQAHRMAQVYVVLNQTLCGFHSMDALTRRGYDLSQVRHVQQCEVNNILPMGPMLQ
jgi:hypothetical protein